MICLSLASFFEPFLSSIVFVGTTESSIELIISDITHRLLKRIKKQLSTDCMFQNNSQPLDLTIYCQLNFKWINKRWQYQYLLATVE